MIDPCHSRTTIRIVHAARRDALEPFSRSCGGPAPKLIYVLLFCFVFLPSHSWGQTVLERVIESFPKTEKPTGFFSNSASNFGGVTAGITTLADRGTIHQSHVSDALALRIPGLSTGPVAATALGGINSGDVVLGIDVFVGQVDRVPTPVNPASVTLVGYNTDFTQVQDDLSVSTARAASQQVESIREVLGAGTSGSLVAGNSALNMAEIRATVLNRTSAVSLHAMETTSTALGAVNTGITEILGTNKRPFR